MRFDLITIFPEFFAGPLNVGVLRRAQERGLVEVHATDLRAFAHDRHRTVDDRPYGGGEGMVVKPGPIFEAVESLRLAPRAERAAHRQCVLLLSAQGRSFTQAMAHDLAAMERVVLICGRYEGVDERVNDLLCDAEVSIGDYVLSGGELGAAVIIDAVVRLLPGVLGNPDSARYESFGADELPNLGKIDGVPRSTHGAGGLLDYPHYTRPEEFRGSSVPAQLANGDHEAIRRWRRRGSLRKTLRNRPELLDRARLSAEDERTLHELRAEQAALAGSVLEEAAVEEKTK